MEYMLELPRMWVDTIMQPEFEGDVEMVRQALFQYSGDAGFEPPRVEILRISTPSPVHVTVRPNLLLTETHEHVILPSSDSCRSCGLHRLGVGGLPSWCESLR